MGDLGLGAVQDTEDQGTHRKVVGEGGRGQ